jgi:predicted HicB family RNase H-like nuclease
VTRGEGRKPLRAIRVEDQLWRDAMRVAQDRGESLNAAIVRFLRRYVDDHPADD